MIALMIASIMESKIDVGIFILRLPMGIQTESVNS